MDFSYTEELVIKDVRPADQEDFCSTLDKDVRGARCIYYSGKNMCGRDVLVKLTENGFLFSFIYPKSPWSSAQDFLPPNAADDEVTEDRRKAYMRIVELFLEGQRA
jgi:hypothetical protein